MFSFNLVFALGLAVPATAFVQLPAGTTWDYPLGDKSFSAKSADPNIKAYGVDLVNTAQSDISQLKQDGHYVICYFSGGSVESYRDDAKDFPSAAVGKVMKGWRDEKWVDTRNGKVRDIMTKRITLAQSKGCDGVDVDNVDGYSNDTGFDMTEDDAIAFVKAMADDAHSKDLAYGLKNGGAFADQVTIDVQWVINEQCAQYNECDAYKGLLDAGKPVFHVEYTDDEKATTVDPDFMKKSCAAGGLQGASTIVKHLNLDRWIVSCSSSKPSTNTTTASVTQTASSSPSATVSATSTPQGNTNGADRMQAITLSLLGVLLPVFAFL